MSKFVIHKKLIFFALQSSVISHQRHSRMAALFYVHDYSHYVNMGLLISIIGLTYRIISTLARIIGKIKSILGSGLAGLTCITA